MRKRYIQCPDTLELVEADKYCAPAQLVHQFMPDIQPYKSMVTGEVIGGRAQHREHLRRHNLIEIGNETKYISNQKKMEIPGGLKGKIAEIVNCKL